MPRLEFGWTCALLSPEGGVCVRWCNVVPFQAAGQGISREDSAAQPGAERLQAMQEAKRWGDRRCLPLLRRGQRDATVAVALAAARALEAFRGEPLGGYRSTATTGSGKASLPRNVARMR